jgi:hypothetical protein
MQSTGNAEVDALIQEIESVAVEFKAASDSGDEASRLAADERLVQAVDNLYNLGLSLGAPAVSAFIALLQHPYRVVHKIARDVLEDIGTPEALEAAERTKPTPAEMETMRQALKNRHSKSG